MASLQHLPLETIEELLLQLPTQELLNLCSTSSQFYSLCVDPRFWRRRFREFNLPLLVEGNSIQEWLEIFQRSLEAKEKAEDYLSKVPQTPSIFFSSSPAKLSSLQPLYWLGLRPNVEAWKKTEEKHKLLSLSSSEIKEAFWPLELYSSSISIRREKDGTILLTYSYSTPEIPLKRERVVLTPEELEDFLFIYFYYGGKVNYAR